MTKRRRVWTLEPLESRRLLATITVNTTGDADSRNAAVSLREAIEIANGTLAIGSLSQQEQAQVSGQLSSTNAIAFNIPGSGVQTITPNSPLPYITSSVILNGYTQPGSSSNTSANTDNAVLKIQISGANAGPSTDGIFLNGLGASNSTIEGLIMNNWGVGGHIAGQAGGRAIVIYQSGGGNVVSGNFIGTDSTGMTGVPNAVGGIQLDHSIADQIGGPNPADRNVILVGGNGSSGALTMWGLYASNSTQATIQGNFVGVNAAGNQFSGFTPPGGVYGLTLIDSTGIFVGGGDSGDGNVVTSVWIGTLTGTVYAANNFLTGNTIGFNASHTLGLNGTAGIVILNASGNVIGGNTGAAGNLIGAMNAVAIDVIADDHAADLSTLIEGNTIGAIPPTSNVFHQFDGIRLSSSGNTVGGLAPGLGNVIAHNTSYGVEVYNNPAGTTPTSGTGTATNNQILSNTIIDSGLGSIAANALAPQIPQMKLVSATPSGGNLFLTGLFGHAAPGASYLIQFYADLSPSANYPAQPQRLLTTEKVVAPSNGLTLFSTMVAAGRVPAGAVITANVTPLVGGNTSQFAIGAGVGSPVAAGVGLTVTSGTPTVGQTVAITANVASDAVNWATPTGKMVIFDNGNALSVTNVVGNGYGYFTVPALTSGQHVITVKYSGDSIFPGATSAPLSIGSQGAAPQVTSVARQTISSTQANVVITFNSALDPTSANNANNYEMIALKAQGSGYVVTGNFFPVTSAAYNATNNTVTVVPSIGLSSTTLYVIVVEGTIKNPSGVFLNGAGSAGTNYTSRV